MSATTPRDANKQSRARRGIPQAVKRSVAVNSLAEGLGDATARTLLPIIAVTVAGTSAGVVGVINAASLTMFLLVGSLAGVAVDRFSTPYRFMQISTLCRVALLSGLFVLWGAGLLSGWLGAAILVAVAALLGVADVAYTAGQGKLLPRLVSAEHLSSLYGTVVAWAGAGAVAGPLVLAAVLYVVSGPVVAVVPLLAYVFAVGALRSIAAQCDDEPQAKSAGVDGGVLERIVSGYRHLRRYAALWQLTWSNACLNCGVMMANTAVPLLVMRSVGAPASAYAAIGMGGAAAGVVGASVAARMVSACGLVRVRVGCGLAMVLTSTAVLCSSAVLGILPGSTLAWVALNAAFSGASVAILSVSGADLPARLVPEDSLGVALAAQRTIALGLMPVAAVTAGVLISWWGMAVAVSLWLVLQCASVWLSSRIRVSTLVKQ